MAMYYSLLRTILFVFLSIFYARGQSTEPFGAKALGIGNTYATVSDEWASSHNIAGLANQKYYAVGLAYKSSFSIHTLGSVSAHIIGPLWKGGYGLSFYRFGREAYTINRISTGYANRIGVVQLGLQLHYLQTSIYGLGTRGNIILDFGGIVELLPSQLYFGASVFNLNQAEQADELLPVLMKAGLSYRSKNKLMLNAELEKDLNYKPMVKIGMEYLIVKKVAIRTGLNTNPFIHFFGLGIKGRTMQADLAVSKHPSLGPAISFSLLFSLTKPK